MLRTIVNLFKPKCNHDFQYHHVHLCVHGLEPTHIVEYCNKCGTSKHTFYNGSYYYNKMVFSHLFYDKDEYGNKKVFDNLTQELYDYYQKQFYEYASKNSYFLNQFKESKK